MPGGALIFTVAGEGLDVSRLMSVRIKHRAAARHCEFRMAPANAEAPQLIATDKFANKKIAPVFENWRNRGEYNLALVLSHSFKTPNPREYIRLSNVNGTFLGIPNAPVCVGNINANPGGPADAARFRRDPSWPVAANGGMG